MNRIQSIMANLKHFFVYLLYLPYIYSIRTYYMDELCGQTIDMGMDGIHAGRLKLTEAYNYASNMNCRLVIKASYGERVMFAVSDFDTETDNDELKIYSGRYITIPDYTYPEESYSGHTDPLVNANINEQEATLIFTSDSSLEYTGFNIIFTEFHKGTCDGYRCYGGECIDGSLKCDGIHNCDNTVDDDELCLLSTGAIVGIVVGSAIGVTIIGMIAVFVLRKIAASGRSNTHTPPVVYNVPQQFQPVQFVSAPVQGSAPPSYSTAMNYSQQFGATTDKS